MRLPASEKLEIIRLVEQSHLPARRTLKMLGIKPSTFYRWYDRYRSSGPPSPCCCKPAGGDADPIARPPPPTEFAK